MKKRETDSIVEDTKIESKPINQNSEPLPPLINREEFFMLASKTNYIETLGGFYSWLKREGVSSKLPLVKWQQLLSEFRHRKV